MKNLKKIYHVIHPHDFLVLMRGFVIFSPYGFFLYNEFNLGNIHTILLLSSKKYELKTGNILFMN